MAVTLPERLKVTDMIIVDADVHVTDTPGALAPYADMPWRKSLELLGEIPLRYLDIPGFAPKLALDAPIPGGHAARGVRSPTQMREELSALSIDVAVLFPDNLLQYAVIPNVEYATAIMHAYNRWLMAEWVTRAEGLYGAMLASPQNPEATAREIERYAKEEKIVGVYLPTAGVHPLWGDRKYDPIMAAADAADIPLLLHSVTVITPQFPYQLDQFENHFARQVLSHSFSMMANLVSIMHTGDDGALSEPEVRLHGGGCRLGAILHVAHGPLSRRISSPRAVPRKAAERIHERADVVRDAARRRARQPAASHRHHPDV
jgi:hypothetical protein